MLKELSSIFSQQYVQIQLSAFLLNSCTIICSSEDRSAEFWSLSLFSLSMHEISISKWKEKLDMQCENWPVSFQVDFLFISPHLQGFVMELKEGCISTFDSQALHVDQQVEIISDLNTQLNHLI